MKKIVGFAIIALLAIVEYFYTDELGNSYKNKEKISEFDIDYFKIVKRLPLATNGKKVFINYGKL